MTDKQPILIVGLPRSGTTWVGEVLSSAQRATYIFEPDNEGLSPIAWLCKQDMHRFPYLTAGDDAPEYLRMWRTVLCGDVWSWYANVALGLWVRRVLKRKPALESHMGEKSGLQYIDEKMHWVGKASLVQPYDASRHRLLAGMARRLLVNGDGMQPRRRVIVKSVHASLSVEWIAARFAVRPVIVLRNPYSLYASYQRMRLPDGYRNLLFQPSLQRDWGQFVQQPSPMLMREQEDPVAFQIMCMYKIMETQFARHPEWTVISHDRFCVNPHADYGRLFEDLNLAWSETTDKKIDTLNTPGKDFDPRRVSKDQPHKWRSELSERDRAAIQRWTDAFELNDFLRERVDLN